MSNRIVMAIGDSGLPEPTPESETVEIACMPVGPDNIIIPATIRSLRRAPTEEVPLCLLSIRRACTRLNSREYPLVTFKCTPYERYRTNNGPVLSGVKSCYVCNERDARDPLFDSLSVRERFRIWRAVVAAGGLPASRD